MASHKKIRKILIANRGEIALRIMRSAQEMGIQTVAVFSEADRGAPHVRFADEAFCIGPPPSSESYLNAKKIIETAQKADADAIHPGYGFLSENAAFSDAVAQAGLTFIGPSARSIALMGNKLTSKETVARNDVPLIPGAMHAVTDPEEARKMADDIGYPVLIKASSGGGGKGMRIVHQASELAESMERAIGEAQSSFGDGSVFIERYIAAPRHIEFQIMADTYGHTVHLFERECSIQRRHQKVIEEAPSSVLDAAMREKMGHTAVMAAKSCNYCGAGTVEFIVDERGDFYFLEMNTRLQVEHPVTEAITGLDLVRLQIAIAQGEKLPFAQRDLHIRGHAIEARIYAEDPAKGFLPDTGTLSVYSRPQGHGVRVDDGFEQGMTIPVHYDPLIGKLVCYAASREEAIEKMRRAIAEYRITGPQTTLDFCDFVMQHEAFRSGRFDTRFVERYFSPEALRAGDREDEKKIAIVAALQAIDAQRGPAVASPAAANPSRTWRKRRY